MKIIDRNKDYYDYLQGIYGMDELVVYDRRDSFPIDVSKPICDKGTFCRDYYNANFDRWFRREILFDDEKRKEVSIFGSNSVARRRADAEEEKKREEALSKGHRIKTPKRPLRILEGKIMHFILEIGFYDYYFEVERYIDDKDDKKLILKYALIDRDKEQLIKNPILYSTYIPKFIEPKEVWNNLYEYISSLRDVEFEDTRTNDQHIESHGFDKKISFRHRK